MRNHVGWMLFGTLCISAIVLVSQLRLGDTNPRHPLISIYAESNNSRIHRRLLPGQEIIYDGLMVRIPATTIRTNSQGFRDHEHPLDKSEGLFRIVVLGDSMAFGLGVEQNETFPAHLEALLQLQGRYEVINLAVPGFSTDEEVALFEQTGEQYQPNMVIVQHMDNDWFNMTRVQEIFEQERVEGGDKDVDPRGAEMRVYEAYWTETANLSFPQRWSAVGGPLRELHARLGETPVILLTFSFNETDIRALDALGTELNWTVLLAGEIYRGVPYDRLIVHPHDVHPSALGHLLVAQALTEEIIG